MSCQAERQAQISSGYRNVNKSVELANKAYLPTIQLQLQKIPHGTTLSSIALFGSLELMMKHRNA